MREKSIIFDLGGIFISLDYRRTEQAFSQVGYTFDYFSQTSKAELLYNFEIGKISAAQFRAAFREQFLVNSLEDREFDSAWNAMLIALLPERINLLSELREKYRLFLFSNINEIHEQRVASLFHHDVEYEKFLAHFDRIYYSHRCGFRKPDTQSFMNIIHENVLVPNKTLFIDDMKANLVGAVDAGMHVCHLLPDDNLAIAASL